MGASPTCNELVFGRFVVRPGSRQQLVEGEPVKLGARAFDLLLALVERRERIVSKNELFDLIWPRVVVEENNLQVHVSALRKLLGPQAIATIPGRGYKFTLTPEGLDAASSAPTQPLTATAAAEAGGNLPSELPPLYGRDEDVAALTELIERHRLVSIVGAGGIGKTRVAQAVAHCLRDAYPDGVWLVELASLFEPELVVSTVARVLGHALGPKESELASLVEAMHEQKLMLVLDNCEHLAAAVDELAAAILVGAPHVHLLITSQEPLRRAEEQVDRLRPLAVPETADAATAPQYGAVALFDARARAADANFALNEDNVAAVIDICAGLDGIALAIELAAARVSLLGVQGVRQRLSERLRLLARGTRTALPRHRTIRAALEWSYRLLSDDERTVLDRLGVFVGSFSLEAAQWVASDEHIDEWAALDHLSTLVDKSLVMVEAGELPRYRLLETGRAFALERLEATGATEIVRRRHAEAILEAFERSHAGQRRGALLTTEMARVAPDLDNLRAALSWASRAPGGGRIGISLIGASACGNFFGYLGLYSEAKHWCEVFKLREDESASPTDAARLWLASARVGSAGRYEQAVSDCDRALELLGDTGELIGRFEALTSKAVKLTVAGRTAEALNAIQEARLAEQSTWPSLTRARLAEAEGLCCLYSGDFFQAKHHFEEAHRRFREGGDDRAAMQSGSWCAEVELMVGDSEIAANLCQCLIDEARSARRGLVGGLVFRVLGTAMLELGRIDDAEAAYADALPLIRRGFGTVDSVLDDMSYLLAQRGRIDDAARIAAYADRDYAASGRKRRPSSGRNRERLMRLLGSLRSEDELTILKRDGEALRESEACRLAFGDSARASVAGGTIKEHTGLDL